MAFDECTEYPAERSRAQASMEMTLRWAKRSKEYFEAHKEEVPWYGASLSRSSPLAIRSSQKRVVRTRSKLASERIWQHSQTAGSSLRSE